MEFFNLKSGNKERCKDEHGYCMCDEQQILDCVHNNNTSLDLDEKNL